MKLKMIVKLKKSLKSHSGKRYKVGTVGKVIMISNDFSEKDEYFYVVRIDGEEVCARIKDIEFVAR